MGLYIGIIIIAVGCTAFALLGSSQRIKTSCTAILLAIAILGAACSLLSHRLAIKNSFAGEMKETTQSYTEAEKNALRKGIMLNWKISTRMLPLMLIPTIGLFAIANRRKEK